MTLEPDAEQRAEALRLAERLDGVTAIRQLTFVEQNTVFRALLAAEAEVAELREQISSQTIACNVAVTQAEHAEARVKRLEEALRRVRENALSWHGPVPIQTKNGAYSGHALALAVIAEWCDAALSEPTEGE